MSFARIALRTAAVEALRGKTNVGSNVLDSGIGAFDVAADGTTRTDQTEPFISVYTENAVSENPARQAPLLYSGTVDVLFEYGIAANMTETDPDTGESTIMTVFPATDAAFELFLDIIGRQIVNALTDPSNPWAVIWQGVATKITKVVRRRTADVASGTRVAAHQLVVTVETLREPQTGAARDADCPYMRFLAKLDAGTPAQARIGTALRGLLLPVDANESATWRRTFGLREIEAGMLGRGSGTWPSEIEAVIDE